MNNSVTHWPSGPQIGGTRTSIQTNQFRVDTSYEQTNTGKTSELTQPSRRYKDLRGRVRRADNIVNNSTGRHHGVCLKEVLSKKLKQRS